MSVNVAHVLKDKLGDRDYSVQVNPKGRIGCNLVVSRWGVDIPMLVTIAVHFVPGKGGRTFKMPCVVLRAGDGEAKIEWNHGYINRCEEAGKNRFLDQAEKIFMNALINRQQNATEVQQKAA